MNSANSQPLAMRLLRGLARRVAAVISECRYAHRTMNALRTAPDNYALRPDSAPDTYGEFLYRTSGVLLHEPSASARAHGSFRPR
jgi:hypothetical protein